MSRDCQTVTYFAYGSNMSVKRLKARNIEFVTRKPCRLFDYKLMFNVKDDEMLNPLFDSKKGYANICRKPGAIVEGFIYGIAKVDIEKLNKIEGGYSKTSVIVKTKDDKEHSAITFVGNVEALGEGLLPPSWYMKYLIEGASELSTSYQKLLDSFTVLNEAERG